MTRPMTRSDLRTEVYNRLGESTGFFTDAQINQWLNDGMDDVALQVEPIIANATIDVTAGTNEYLLPSDLISIKTVLFQDSSTGDWLNIDEITYLELFRQNPAWENDTATTPTNWYWRTNILGLYPNPDTSISGGLRIVHTCRPAEMTTDSDTTNLDDWLDRCVVLYAVYQARLKDRDEARAVVAASDYRRATAQAVHKLNKQRKEHAPRFQPDTRSYRQAYFNERHTWRPRIVVS